MKASHPFFKCLSLSLAVAMIACSSDDESSSENLPPAGSDAGHDVTAEASADATPGQDGALADVTADTAEGASPDSSSEASLPDASSEASSEAGAEAGHDGSKPACGTPQAVAEWPTAGYLMHFTAAGEHAHALVTSTSGVAHITTWLQNTSDSLGIPGGPIELNSQYNPGYSYRLIPDQVSFGDMWMELCDAAPCYIEQDPAGWLATPTSWCPWGFSIVDVWDCRTNTAGNQCLQVYP